MELMIGGKRGITAESRSVTPVCPNSTPGGGNCKGMIKSGTCPLSRGFAGKYDKCDSFFKNHKPAE
ncbi:MAG: hypothetical protein ACD_7C00245G0002 [uncultured bacterium]